MYIHMLCSILPIYASIEMKFIKRIKWQIHSFALHLLSYDCWLTECNIQQKSIFKCSTYTNTRTKKNKTVKLGTESNAIVIDFLWLAYDVNLYYLKSKILQQQQMWFRRKKNFFFCYCDIVAIICLRSKMQYTALDSDNDK